MTKILLVEDDTNLRETLAYNLRREGYTPLAAADAGSAVSIARLEKPELIILDLMLPGGSGIDVCREIRAFSKAPIIMLTARTDDVDRVLGLEMGADDYVTKPFSLRELLARVRANLRRVTLDSEPADSTLLEYLDLQVDLSSRRVELDGKSLRFQPREFDLLAYLLKHRGVVLTREQLLADVWGHDFVGQRTVDVHIRRVRSKLERAGVSDLIRTVHGVGYSLSREESS